MSVLSGKHVLVVGEETAQISQVEAALVTYGATITTAVCETTDVDKIITQDIDLLVLNHLHEGTHCRLMLQALQQEDLEKRIPVFALVPNDQMHIRDVLVQGATDYILEREDPHMVVEKIKLALDDGKEATNSTVIDLTPQVQKKQRPGTRVFVAEDDPLLSNLLAVRFERSEISFEIVANGEGIVAKITDFKPQVIILDIMLPGKDGLDLLAEIKQSPLSDIPVVIFSNKDEQSARDRAKELGAASFYVKALTDLSELLEVIDDLAYKQ